MQKRKKKMNWKNKDEIEVEKEWWSTYNIEHAYWRSVS